VLYPRVFHDLFHILLSSDKIVDLRKLILNEMQ
jgi:hypothetical protein